MFTNILITLDGSEYSERVLAYASDLARPQEATVTLLQVVPSGDAEDSSYLAARRTELSQAGVANVEIEVRSGHPTEVILDTARRLGVDLIAMSTQGVGATSETGLGSTAARILEAAPCPVLMVRVHRPAPPQSIAEQRWQAEGGRNVG